MSAELPVPAVARSLKLCPAGLSSPSAMASSASRRASSCAASSSRSSESTPPLSESRAGGASGRVRQPCWRVDAGMPMEGASSFPAYSPVVAALSALLHHLLPTDAMAVLVSGERLVVRCRRERVCALAMLCSAARLASCIEADRDVKAARSPAHLREWCCLPNDRAAAA